MTFFSRRNAGANVFCQVAWTLLAGAALLFVAAGPAEAQDRIKAMPGYDQHARMSKLIPGSFTSGGISPTWAPDSRSFEYVLDGRRWRYSLRTTETSDGRGWRYLSLPGRAVDIGSASGGPQAERSGPVSAQAETLVLARGRGAEANVMSPNLKFRAFSRDRNVFIAPMDGGPEIALSTDGDPAARIRNGVGSYLYLEEFGVSSPVWWSPDSSKMAWMRYDESKVADYYVALDQSKMRTSVLAEAYPHPGEPNPVADLFVYDLASGTATRMDVRDGQPFGDDVVGHYVWDASWTKDGAEILVRRADRRQKTLDLAACSASTGACRSVVRESRPKSWAAGAPFTVLKAGKRFIWRSDRSDFRNLYLYDLSGRMIAQLTDHAFDVGEVLQVDETGGWVWYTARSGDNPMKMQLHRVKLNGADDRRLTDPAFHHRIILAPDAKHFIDVAQTHDAPPETRLMNDAGKTIAVIARSDMKDFERLGFKPAEIFTFTSADKVTQLHGLIQYPSNFDPAKSYPVLLSVYGGPGSNGVAETFYPANPLAEYGFLMVRLDARTADGKGKQVIDQVYQQLTVAEIDDFAAGLTALRSRPYVDAGRIGVYGTSYGGTVAAALLFRYPDLVQAANSNSPVTDYRLYDTAYSERYLGLPQTDKAAYDRAAVLNYVGGMKGDLLLYYGTSDDNVHPKNTLQLIQALQKAGKSFEIQIGPDRGHTGVDATRMMEFFIERLVVDKPPAR